MGKITGFLERAARGAARPVGERSTTGVLPAPVRRGRRGAGRALHGLRHPVLHVRLPGRTTSFRTGTTSYIARTGKPRSRCCTPPTTSPSSPAASAPPCEEACVLRINADPVGIKSIEHAIIDKAGKKAGCSRSRPRTRPARRWRSSVRAAQGLRARSSSRAGHAVTVFEKATASGACCATASRTSSLKAVIDRRLEQLRAEA